MAHRLGACAASLAALGLGLAAYAILWPPAGPDVMGRPLAWALALWGLGLAAGGALAGLLGAGHPDHGEGMLGTMLLRTDRPALALSALGLGALSSTLVAAAAGFVAPDVPVLGLRASDWTFYAALSLLSLSLALPALASYVWSGGRGSRARKAAAGRHHAMAILTALAPWALRALFGA
ncbi:MAG: hypothetical protein QOE90_2557 [Thermoplasmata archaeon]|nr:hypothetical protein [Thermoplasmata archaeon]